MPRIAIQHVALIAFAMVFPFPVAAQTCGWSHVDHRVGYDASGLWDPSVYRGVVGALTVGQIGGAIWEGSATRFGKTMWQATDSEIIADLGAAVSKHIFTRVRPSTENNPCLWFQGGSNYSFPSGEAAVAAALITPYVLEYGHEYALTYGLLLLPAWVGVARIKNQAHWQTDVLAGWAVGGVSGWYAQGRDEPLLIQVLPHGFAVGMRVKF